ncbi:DUF1648 domain-containing protein [Chryseobacterium profundimaris]|uniref:DUF1648 domain-containing protein n=1 Tax=Chryseobacterium profundimaris TaxID=1387275 RepID=A0ABY1P5H9_9FLAO|nr:DUF1648 domain-containing protein [Chryseobacterium profundimaris]SMP26914.1 Protein of unknown function [Chryseobacterium profundimaris]
MENILLLIFDVLNFGLLVFLWWFSIKNYKALPENIPTHFDFYGKADSFGNKKYFYLMPVFLTIFYFLFLFIAIIPESANYPVPITEKNKDSQFLIMGIFMRWLFLLLALIFLNNQDYMLRYSLSNTAKPRVAFSTLLFSIIGSLVVLFIFVGLFK